MRKLHGHTRLRNMLDSRFSVLCGDPYLRMTAKERTAAPQCPIGYGSVYDLGPDGDVSSSESLLFTLSRPRTAGTAVAPPEGSMKKPGGGRAWIRSRY